ncbi:GTP-binding protein [archaeon]|nr:MAG: GTP-binding protein [archaeon]
MGKTTLLYKMRQSHEEIETSIPTIGFNVETLKTKSNAYKCWDVGGCDKIRPLWRHYMTDLKLLIFMIDSNDVERLDDALQELKYMLMEESLLSTPVLLLANKQDLPRAQSAQAIVDKMNLHAFTGREWYVLPITLMGITDSVRLVRSWLDYFASNNLEGCRAVKGVLYKLADGTTNFAGSFDTKKPQSKEIPIPAQAPYQNNLGDSAVAKLVNEHDLQKVEAMKASWLEREDETDEMFLEHILDGTSEVWDHYVHIRLAYVYVTMYGVKQGFELVSCAIKTYLDMKAGKQSFHATMTNFWCHMLSFALYTLHSDTGHVSLKELVLALFTHKDLVAFDLWSGRAFGKWFSSAVMFSAEARITVLKSDQQDLPSLLNLLRQKDDLSRLPSHGEDIAFLLELV